LCSLYNIPINFSIIPFRKIKGQFIPFKASKAEHLIVAYHAGYIEISQHGYAHENNAAFSQQYPSEFVGIGLELQLQWLKKGKEIIINLFGAIQ